MSPEVTAVAPATKIAEGYVPFRWSPGDTLEFHDPGTAAVPTAKGLGSGLLRWGIPLLAGIGGFFAGDVFDAYGLVGGFFDFGSLPFSDKFDVQALAAAGVYGIGIMILMAIEGRVPGGTVKEIVFRTVKFGLVGVTGRLALRALIPSRVTATGVAGIPIPNLTP